jgi:hypothetical protein
VADPFAQYDVDPIRPGAEPRLSVSGAGLTTTNGADQPIYVRMTNALTRVLRYGFGAASRIEYPDLVDRVWVEGESSPIQISSLAEWRPASASARPAILIDRLDQDHDVTHRAIGDQYQGVKPGAFSWLVTGAHAAHCIGGRDGEAEILGAQVWRNLKRWAPIIRQSLCLVRFLPVKIGRRAQIAEFKQHYVVSVIVTYGYWEASRIIPLDEEEITSIRLSL